MDGLLREVVQATAPLPAGIIVRPALLRELTAGTLGLPPMRIAYTADRKGGHGAIALTFGDDLIVALMPIRSSEPGLDPETWLPLLGSEADKPAVKGSAA